MPALQRGGLLGSDLFHRWQAAELALKPRKAAAVCSPPPRGAVPVRPELSSACVALTADARGNRVDFLIITFWGVTGLLVTVYKGLNNIKNADREKYL